MGAGGSGHVLKGFVLTHLVHECTSTYVHQYTSTAILTSILVGEPVDQQRPAVADNVCTDGVRIKDTAGICLPGFLDSAKI